MHGPELTQKETVKDLAIAGLSVLGGIAVKNEAVKAGLAVPIAFVLGLGATAASLLIAPRFLGAEQSQAQATTRQQR